MIRSVIRSAFAFLAVMALSTPSAAQLRSEGYEFLEAVKDREGSVVTEMLDRPGSQVVNTRDLTSGETGLHIVTARRDLQWVRFLLQNGANANIADNDGRTPLIIASELGFVEAVEALVRNGARVDIANSTGETPLIAAVHSGNLALIEALVAAGANPDLGDASGRTARDYASMPGTNPRVLAAIEHNENADGNGNRIYGPVF